MLPSKEGIVFIKRPLLFADCAQLLDIFISKGVTEDSFRQLTEEKLKQILPLDCYIKDRGLIYKQVQDLISTSETIAVLAATEDRINRLNTQKKELKEILEEIGNFRKEERSEDSKKEFIGYLFDRVGQVIHRDDDLNHARPAVGGGCGQAVVPDANGKLVSSSHDDDEKADDDSSDTVEASSMVLNK